MWTQLVVLSLTLQAAPSSETEIELEGVIASSSGSTIELFQGLIRVDIAEAAPAFELRPGISVELTAIATSSGLLRAREVELGDDDDANSEIRGEISAVDRTARTFRIGPIVIAWTEETTFEGMPGPDVGVIVEMTVRVSEGRLVAETIEREER